MQLIKTSSIREFPVKDRQTLAFKQACMAAAGCYKTPAEAEREIVQLEEKLLTEAKTINLRAAEESPEPTGKAQKIPLKDRIQKTFNQSPKKQFFRSQLCRN